LDDNHELLEFIALAEGNPFKDNIDPDEIDCMFPDFGFDNKLTFLEDFGPVCVLTDTDGNSRAISKNWKFFMDTCSQ